MFKESRERRSEASRKKGSFCLSLFLIHSGQWRNAKKKHTKTENSCLGCLKAPVLHLMCGYCLPTSNYLIQNQTFSMLQGHQDGKHLAVRVLLVFCLFVCLFVFCRSRINVMCMCHNSSQFCCYCFCMQVSQGAFWCSGLVLLVWASILMAAAAEGKRIKSENHLTFCPFLIGVPEDDVNI